MRDYFKRIGTAIKTAETETMSPLWADHATGAAPSYVYEFVSNEGTWGIVQMNGTVGPYENGGSPLGIKIRYKFIERLSRGQAGQVDRVSVSPAKPTDKPDTKIERIIHRGGFPGETRVILSGERESLAAAIQREIGRKLTEAGASYSKLDVVVAENLDNAKVSFQGLRNFRNADGTITGDADGHFTLSLSPNGGWGGELGGTRFTLEPSALTVDPEGRVGARAGMSPAKATTGKSAADKAAQSAESAKRESPLTRRAPREPKVTSAEQAP